MMHWKPAAITAIIAGLAPAAMAAPLSHTAKTAAVRHRSAPTDSYLNYNSYSLEEVLHQVEDSPKLRQRYASHFHIAPNEVVPYFRQNLVESFIPRTRTYPIWCARPDGRKYLIHKTFTAGTRVLSLRNGDPVLKWACGNPLSTKLPPVKKKKRRVSHVSPAVQHREVTIVTPFEMPVVTPPRILVASARSYVAPGSLLSTLAHTAFIPAGGHFPLAALLPIGFIHHGGGGGTPPSPPVVPEPSTLALAFTGLATAGLFRRRKA